MAIKRIFRLRLGNRPESAIKSLVFVLLCGALGTNVWAASPVIDCPLRDQPYSVDTPVMDIMLNAEAREIVERQVPAILNSLPPSMLSVEATSLSAIMSVRSMVQMLRLPPEAVDLKGLDSELRLVDITEKDKRQRCDRYSNETPELALGDHEVQVLVFDKINGFDHGPAVDAATASIQHIARELGWGVTVTEKAGVFAPGELSNFDVVVWNNVSGDVLTLTQRDAFRRYMENGGGFLGIHGAGGDFIYLWDWYVDSLLGAQFIGHTMAPHFQDARIIIEENPGQIAADLAPGWIMNDEWYSFAESPRAQGASIVAALDETSYLPEMGGQSLRMGDDHPIAWSQCVKDGRSFYTGIGHRPEVYDVSQNMSLLRDALVWVAGQGRAEVTACRAGKSSSSK